MTCNISFSQVVVDSLLKLGNTFYKKNDFLNAAGAEKAKMAAMQDNERYEENDVFVSRFGTFSSPCQTAGGVLASISI